MLSKMGVMGNPIVYVGSLANYMGAGIPQTAASRMKGLQNLGLNIIPFDSTACLGRGTWTQRLNHRFYIGTSVRRMNTELARLVAKTKPEVVWVDKGYWIYPRTLRMLKEYSRYLVHYNTDDIFNSRAYSWLHRHGIQNYDLYLTTNRSNVSEISSRYGVSSLRSGMGYDLDYFREEKVRAVAKSQNVVFIGHWEPHSESFVNELHRETPVRVWGDQWRKASNPMLRNVQILSPDRYVSTIASARITLCFLSRHNRNESTGRSFEIPAVGGFLLAERTAEHEYIYGDGMGAALFSDARELIEKAKYYLAHPKERDRVAAAGHQRCMILGLSWQEQMQREWPLVEKALYHGTRGVDTVEHDDPFWPGFRAGRLPGASPTSFL